MLTLFLCLSLAQPPQSTLPAAPQSTLPGCYCSISGCQCSAKSTTPPTVLSADKLHLTVEGRLFRLFTDGSYRPVSATNSSETPNSSRGNYPEIPVSSPTVGNCANGQCNLPSGYFTRRR
jgi:hypothetical protein